MNIAIVGAGAIGGWVGAKLASGGNRVAAVSSLGRVERIAIVEDGTRREAPMSGFEGPADVLVIAVKAPALAAAAEAARAVIGPETLIVPMLNGVPWWFTEQPLKSVDAGGKIAASLPIEQVIGCVVHASCRRTAPHEVEVVHSDKLILGEPGGGASERIAALCRLFKGAGIRCEQSDSIRHAIWYKLWGNATINPLSALTRSTADKLLEDNAIRAFMAEAMDELAEVGAAVGCTIEESAEDRMEVTARLGAFKSSMLQDVEAGRPIELEALLRAPLEIAGRAGVSTPQMDRLYAMTSLLAQNLG